MNGPTPEVWALVEYWQAVLDKVVWWFLLPFVVICVIAALIEAFPPKGK